MATQSGSPFGGRPVSRNPMAQAAADPASAAARLKAMGITFDTDPATGAMTFHAGGKSYVNTGMSHEGAGPGGESEFLKSAGFDAGPRGYYGGQLAEADQLMAGLRNRASNQVIQQMSPEQRRALAQSGHDIYGNPTARSHAAGPGVGQPALSPPIPAPAQEGAYSPFASPEGSQPQNQASQADYGQIGSRFGQQAYSSFAQPTPQAAGGDNPNSIPSPGNNPPGNTYNPATGAPVSPFGWKGSPVAGGPIPTPTGQTGSPFIAPVTGPPTYQNIPGQSGNYSGPFDYWGQGGASGNRQLAGGELFGANSSMLVHPQMDPATRNALEQEGMNAARASTAGVQADIGRRAASSGNTGGMYAAQAMAGRQLGSNLASQARQNTLAETAFAENRRQNALSGLSGLYQGETGYMENLMGARGALAAKPVNQQGQSSGISTGGSSSSNYGLNI